jgi:hypothetical protein
LQSLKNSKCKCKENAKLFYISDAAAATAFFKIGIPREQ